MAPVPIINQRTKSMKKTLRFVPLLPTRGRYRLGPFWYQKEPHKKFPKLPSGQTDTWIGRFYRRKKAHLGAPKAITATAHKIACVVYHMLKYQGEFVPLDVMVYELKAQERRMRDLRKQAEELGYELVERQQAA